MEISKEHFSASIIVRLLSIFFLVGVALNLYVSEHDSQIAKALMRVDPEASLRPLFFYPIFFSFFALLYLDLKSQSKSAVVPYGYAAIFTVVVVFFSLNSANIFGSIIEALAEFVFYSLAISSFRYKNFDKVFLAICGLYFLFSASGCYMQNEYFLMSASHDFSCRGLSQHRNTFAPQLIFVGLLGIAVVQSKNLRRLIILGMVGLVLTTGSVTALSVTCLLFVLYCCRRLIKNTRIHPLFYLVIIMALSLLVVFLGNTMLTVVAEREDSFLIRLLIWQVAPDTLEPYLFFGEGFKSAYSAPILGALSSVTAWDDASGFHNSFFEMWRQFGLFGTILAFISLIAGVIRITYRRSIHEGSSYWFVSAIALYLIYGLVESGFGIAFSIWSLVILRLGWIVLYEKPSRENYHRV